MADAEEKTSHSRAVGDVDAVVLGDVADGGRGEFTGEGTDAHGGEDGTTGGEVTPEGAGGDPG